MALPIGAAEDIYATVQIEARLFTYFIIGINISFFYVTVQINLRWKGSKGNSTKSHVHNYLQPLTQSVFYKVALMNSE